MESEAVWKPGRRTRPVRRLHAACHCHAARPRHLQHAVRLQHLEQAIDLILSARDLDRQRIGCEVDDARPEHVDQMDQPGPALRRGRHFDHGEIAIHGGRRRDVGDRDHVHELVEIRRDPLGLRVVGRHDDRHARDAGLFGAPDGQRLDVVVAPAEKRARPG